MTELVADILEIKGHDVHAVGPLAPVLDAVGVMNKKHCGAVLVLDDGHPMGIFSERDVLVRIVAADRDPHTTRVYDEMTTTIHSVTPQTTLMEAMRLITKKRCRHLPVMDGKRLVGLISSGDITKALQQDLRREVTQLSNYIGGPYLS